MVASPYLANIAPVQRLVALSRGVEGSFPESVGSVLMAVSYMPVEVPGIQVASGEIASSLDLASGSVWIPSLPVQMVMQIPRSSGVAAAVE